MKYLNERMKEKMVRDRKNNQPGHPILCFEECQGACQLKWVWGCVCVFSSKLYSGCVNMNSVLSQRKKVWKKKEKKPRSKSLIWFGSLARGSQAFQASVYSENSWSKQHCFFNFLIKLLWFLQPPWQRQRSVKPCSILFCISAPSSVWTHSRCSA